MEQVDQILAQAAALSAADQRELLRQLHDSIYRPQYLPAPPAQPRVGV